MKIILARRFVVVALALVGMMVLGSPVVQATGPDWDSAGSARFVERGRQILSDDLTVEEGQVIDEDVTVFSGDVAVEEGGRIQGNLLVISGDVEIAEGATVDGDVTAASGNIEIAGSVGGSVASTSGNIRLDSSAQIEGDVSVVSGRLIRDDGATIGGNVAEGPSFRFPGSIAPDAPRAPNGVVFARSGTTFWAGVLAFFGRMIAAILLTVLATVLVVGLFYLRPQIIADTRTILRHQTALSAVVGLVVNLTLLFLAGILIATFCFALLSFVPLLTLIALNVVGWAVASQIVGERIVAWANQPVQESLKIGVGAVVLTGLVAILWAFGGCFRPIAFLVTLGAASMGTGAVILPWLNRRGEDGSGRPGSGAPEPEGPTDGSVSAIAIVPETVRVPESAENIVGTDMAAPIDYLTAEEVNEVERGTHAPEHPTTPDHPDVALSADATDGEQSVELDAAAPIDYRTAQEINTEGAAGDDFTRIRGIGPAFAQRLKQAGLTTFAALAAATPAQVGAILGWPEARVIRGEIIDQAKALTELG